MLESPWPILILGLLVEAVLAIALFQSRRLSVLWAMGGVALVVLLGVLIERNWITDTKLVRQTLLEAAAALEKNDAAGVKACIVIGEDGKAARDKTDSVLHEGEFHEVSISNLEVKFNYNTSPPTTATSFTVVARGKLREGLIEGEWSRPVPMQVQLRKEAGRWLVYGDPKYDVHE